MQPNEKQLLSATEVSELLGITRQRAYALARGPLAPVVVRLGRQVRFNKVKLLDLIDQGGAALPGGWRQEAITETQEEGRVYEH